MKHLLALLLLFSFSAFAGDYYQQRALELQQQQAMEQAIRNELRPDPVGETSDERWERNSREMDDYYHALQ